MSKFCVITLINCLHVDLYCQLISLMTLFLSHGVIIRPQIYTDLHRYTHHYVRVVGDAEPLGRWARAVAISREK